jgi:hypothetical protein
MWKKQVADGGRQTDSARTTWDVCNVPEDGGRSRGSVPASPPCDQRPATNLACSWGGKRDKGDERKPPSPSLGVGSPSLLLKLVFRALRRTVQGRGSLPQYLEVSDWVHVPQAWCKAPSGTNTGYLQRNNEAK